MNDTLDIIVSIIVEFARLLVLFNYMKILFDGRKYSKIITVSGYGIVYVATTLIYLNFHNIGMNLSITLIGFIFITFLYNSKIWKRILCSIILLAISCVIDLFTAYLFSNNPTSDNYVLAGSFFAIFLFFISSLVAKAIFNRKKIEFVLNVWMYVMIISIGSIGVIYAMATDAVVGRKTVIIFSSVLFLIIFIVYNLLVESSEKNRIDKENTILKSQMERFEQEISNNISREESLRIIRHDMKHHMNEIAYFAEQSDVERIAEYVKSITDELNEVAQNVNTGVAAIDGVLNCMLQRAKNQGVNTNSHIVIPENIELSIFDMNIVIGNLFENAIEAAKKCDEPQIDIDIKYNQNNLFISLRNTYDGEINMIRGNLVTTKVDKENHGLGIKSVKNVIKKYGGVIDFITEDNIFIVNVNLSINR